MWIVSCDSDDDKQARQTENRSTDNMIKRPWQGWISSAYYDYVFHCGTRFTSEVVKHSDSLVCDCEWQQRFSLLLFIWNVVCWTKSISACVALWLVVSFWFWFILSHIISFRSCERSECDVTKHRNNERTKKKWKIRNKTFGWMPLNWQTINRMIVSEKRDCFLCTHTCPVCLIRKVDWTTTTKTTANTIDAIVRCTRKCVDIVSSKEQILLHNSISLLERHTISVIN